VLHDLRAGGDDGMDGVTVDFCVQTNSHAAGLMWGRVMDRSILTL